MPNFYGGKNSSQQNKENNPLPYLGKNHDYLNLDSCERTEPPLLSEASNDLKTYQKLRSLGD